MDYEKKLGELKERIAALENQVQELLDKFTGNAFVEEMANLLEQFGGGTL